jgi:uncharacterized protein (TIGR00730 family)
MARIAVFCSSSHAIGQHHLALAAELGAELARRGHDLVSGGGRVSMMGAVARAVRAGGGHTLGVIPLALVGLEVADTGADELVVTGDMRQRKGLMDDAADAFVALPGGLGTLEELLEIWVARTLGMHHKPVVVLDPDGVFAALHDLVGALVAAGFVRAGAAEAVHWAATVGGALDAVETGLRALEQVAAEPVSTPVPLSEEQVEELLEAEP